MAKIRMPDVSPLVETVMQGLCKLRPGLQVEWAEGQPLDKSNEGFVHDKKLVEGMTSWNCNDLKVSEMSQDYRCPIPGCDEILDKGYQGAGGIRYKCACGKFMFHYNTGNIVLQELYPEFQLQSVGLD